MCFFLCVAAGITGCALGEMSDGMIEVLVEGRDAATRDIERLREGKRYYGGKRDGGEWKEWLDGRLERFGRKKFKESD